MSFALHKTLILKLVFISLALSLDPTPTQIYSARLPNSSSILFHSKNFIFTPFSQTQTSPSNPHSFQNRLSVIGRVDCEAEKSNHEQEESKDETKRKGNGSKSTCKLINQIINE